MSEKTQGRKFLEGDRAVVERIRCAIRGIVRGFRFPIRGWEEDVVQEAVGRVFLGLSGDRFRGDSSLKTYSEAVARYTCMEHLRQHKPGGSDPDQLPTRARWSKPEEGLFREEEHRRNLRIFASLPEESRKLLHMIYVERLTYREVAERLGVSELALRLRVHRCRLKAKAARESDRFYDRNFAKQSPRLDTKGAG